jgi:hypothetical protein
METSAQKIKAPTSRKKTSANNDELEKITEKVEGGIIVRRKSGRKVDVEK